MTLKKIESLSLNEAAYLAGFIDGDGCINAQIVSRQDYILKYQIRVSVTFYQKKSRLWFMIGLHKKTRLGVIAERNDGMCTYTITGQDSVKIFLEKIYPFLTIKKKQAWYVLKIINLNSKKMSPSSFLKLCLIVDKFEKFNDSVLSQPAAFKGRLINSATVLKVLKEKGILE